MDGISLPQPSTHPFLSSVKGRAERFHQAAVSLCGTMVLSPERGPHFMLALIFIRQCLDACKANLGDRKFPTADQPNFVGLEIIYIYVYVFE